MNKSETKAKRWLVEKEGYKETDIVFQSVRTPDFLCSDGKSYEVKRLYQRTIWFYNTQIQQIREREKCLILAISDINDGPVAILKPEQLQDGAIIAGIRIKVVESRNLSINLDEKRYRFLLEKGEKASAVAKELLEEKIDEEKEEEGW